MADKTAIVLYSGQVSLIQGTDTLVAPAMYGVNGSFSGQNFESTSAAVVLAPNGVGTVYLRPQGGASATNQLTLTSSGNVTIAGNATMGGNVSSSQNFISTTAVTVVAPTGAGTILLRPNGSGSTSGQMSVNSSGDISFTSILAGTATSVILASAASGAVRLRPNGAGSGTGEVIATTTDITFTTKMIGGGSGDPATPTTWAIAVNGSYGGGMQMRDGAGYTGMYLTSSGADLNFAFGNSTSVTKKFAMHSDGSFELVPGAAPSSPANGMIWYDSAAGKFRKREAGVTSDIGAVSGTGTVTNVSWVTSDGVSASISNPTVTPAITITLGTITPEGINVFGTGTHGEIIGGGSTNSLRIATQSGLGTISIRPDGAASSANSITLSSVGISRDTTPAAGTNSLELATTANIRRDVGAQNYRVVAERYSSHTAARVAGSYALAPNNPAAISGTGTLYNQGVFYFDPADYPTVDGVTAKLRIRGSVYVNDVAPTGTYIFGMYPVTRPGTSGGAALDIFTLGTVVTGSQTATVSAPAADTMTPVVSSDFAMPAAGHYVIGFVQTGTVAASSHLHMSAQLQMRHA